MGSMAINCKYFFFSPQRYRGLGNHRKGAKGAKFAKRDFARPPKSPYGGLENLIYK